MREKHKRWKKAKEMFFKDLLLKVECARVVILKEGAL